MIEAASNLKHRVILMVLYGTGMRRGEVSRLKVSDIDSQRMVIHIRQGKGSRDCDLLLTPKFLHALREYHRYKKPTMTGAATCHRCRLSVARRMVLIDFP